MFVTSNSFDSLKRHFISELGEQFSEREIRSMLFDLIRLRLNDTEIDMISVNDLRFSESDLLYFRDVRKRLLKGEPFQYILGSVHFYGLDLLVEPGVLIPRPETEELVDWVLKTRQDPTILIDLCAGSGCIGLSLKSNFPDANVLAVEKSEEAIKVIQKNVAKSGLSLNLVSGDVLQNNFLQELENGSVDVIISNPPYVLESDKQYMSDHVLKFEPHMALFVEDSDPLLFYRSIAIRAKELLKEGGGLYFEIHENFGQEVVQLLIDLGFVNIELRKDLQGKDRMVRGKI